MHVLEPNLVELLRRNLADLQRLENFIHINVKGENAHPKEQDNNGYNETRESGVRTVARSLSTQREGLQGKWLCSVTTFFSELFNIKLSRK